MPKLSNKYASAKELAVNKSVRLHALVGQAVTALMAFLLKASVLDQQLSTGSDEVRHKQPE